MDTSIVLAAGETVEGSRLEKSAGQDVLHFGSLEMQQPAAIKLAIVKETRGV
jgi:hypothetical protein